MGICEDRELDRQLTECLRNGPSVQLVNNLTPIQPGDWIGIGVTPDPNDTIETIPHPTPVRDRLRAAVADPNTSEQDRQAARETLRISFHE
jgi:hypothetical protein